MTRNNRNHLQIAQAKRHTGAARGGGVCGMAFAGRLFSEWPFPDGP